MKKFLLFFLVAFLLFAKTVSAQVDESDIAVIPTQDFTGQEHIQDFQTAVVVNRDGTIDVKETILYDFGYQYKHGIYRYIPYSKFNAEKKRVLLDFSKFKVTDENGKKYKFQDSDSDFNKMLKIGDPNRTITGAHTYIISYHVEGAIGYFSKHDELYWNATGTEWTVPIAHAVTSITLPQSFDTAQIQLACYTGSSGSTASLCTNAFDKNTAVFETQNALSYNEGLTTIVGFPKGVVAHLEPKIYVPFWERWYGRLLALVIFIAATFWYIIYPIQIIIKWFRYGRDPRPTQGEVSAWYDPPKTPSGRPLTPAECGALVDEKVDNKDISSLIVDLARRGYLKIEERNKKDFYFIQKAGKKGDTLTPFEAILLDGLFKTGSEIRVKDEELYSTISSVKDMIYKSLVADGFFPKNPDTIRTFYIALGSIALTTLNLPVAITAFLFGRAMPVKTQAGADAAAIAKSLKHFLTSQEKQLEFQAKYQYWFERLLPFAVAFGVEKIWADRFKDINLKQPGWYSGYDGSHFNSIYFANSLNSSFSSVASAATPPSSSSSGFSSGGGSSGGGGGGGGGGSW